MGYRIRECRKEKKMSQCELAEKIAKALHTKVADIFFES